MLRIGHGFDVHELVDLEEFKRKYPERKCKLIIGGVDIDHGKVLQGHSDADVLLHAIVDALLGAAGLEDIGTYFPPGSPEYAGKESKFFLEQALKLIQEKNFSIINIDCSILAEKPKLRPHITQMREFIAKTLNINIDQINIKATTTEKLGFTGREEGIAAEAVCLITTCQ
jgi:2-C-methyl-D-erythritol 2,4-cyclodiphosphate synthase